MNSALLGIGCLIGVVGFLVYALLLYAVYWVIDYYTDWPTLVSALLAFLIVSVLGGIGNGARG